MFSLLSLQLDYESCECWCAYLREQRADSATGDEQGVEDWLDEEEPRED